MLRRHLPGLVIIAFFAASAFAQNYRSAVSVNGSDLNTCTTVSPCRSFGAAIAATGAGGEVIALDSAGYGPFTIDRPMTVSGAPGVHAAISVTSGMGINILGASGGNNVVIRNLVLIGNGGTIGIEVAALAQVRVLGCVVRGFSSVGIDSNGGLLVDRTAVIDNPGSGIGVRMANGFPLGIAHATVTNSTIQGNSSGVVVLEYMAVLIRNSIITDNTIGASAISTTDGTNSDLTLESCTIAHNTGAGVQASAIGANNLARVYLSQNVIAYNQQGVQAVSNGAVYSFANNRFVGNGSDGGPFSAATFE